MFNRSSNASARPLRNLWMLREPLLRDCLQTRPNLRLLAAVCHPQWRSRKDQSQAGSTLVQDLAAMFFRLCLQLFSQERLRRLSDCELIAVTCKSFQAYSQHLATPSAKLTPLPTRAAGDLVSSWKVRLLQLQFA